MSTNFEVNRPVEDVFSYVASFENRHQYETGLIESKQTSEGPFGLGSTCRDLMQAGGRKMEYTGRISAFEPNKSFTFESLSGPMEFKGSWSFESVEGGTRLLMEFEGRMKGIMRLFEPLMAMQFKGQMRDSTAKLKAILESQGGG